MKEFIHSWWNDFDQLVYSGQDLPILESNLRSFSY